MMADDARILLAGPRGFCAGVDRAIEIVELALEIYGPPVYVRHEIVHNRHVVETLREKGALFISEIAEVPDEALVIFSAHGVSPEIRKEAAARGLRTIDATCPLVTKVHMEALRFAREGLQIVLIGHRGHVEVEGTLGHAPDRMQLVETVEDAEQLSVRDPGAGRGLAVLTQTTLSVDDTREILDVLRRRFPEIQVPGKDDICYATQNRQNAVKSIAATADLVLVVGAPTSSNSNRLVEVARSAGARSELVEHADGIRPAWLAGARVVGVTAGASTPETLVQGVLERLREFGCTRVEDASIVRESVAFALPAELKRDIARESEIASQNAD
ncbi:MAG: 4-hydroxy-3-methylbut-2-enyl diphosphate reductase [Myxococcota bacterium]|nr:4-hydroxy-3-methylbut-2-enyl diphosphate reductase [Myxococcota bacterium]